MLKEEAVKKHKEKKLGGSCQTCLSDSHVEPSETPFNIFLFSVLGFALLMLVVVPLIWR